MISEEGRQYIREQINRQVNPTILKNNLLKMGWSNNDVEDAIRLELTNTPGLDLSQPSRADSQPINNIIQDNALAQIPKKGKLGKILLVIGIIVFITIIVAGIYLFFLPRQ